MDSSSINNALLIDYSTLETSKLLVADNSTDVELLQRIAHLVLEKDNIQELERLLFILISNLEQRTSVFEKDRFSLKRFEGWCSVLCNLSGLFSTANMRFLYETGYLISDEVYDRLLGLFSKGLSYSHKKVGSIMSPVDWEKSLSKSRYNHRKNLANGLNYLARDYYIFARSNGFETLNLIEHHYDILVQIFVFSDLRVNNPHDFLYKSVLIAFHRLNSYFDDIYNQGFLQTNIFYTFFHKNTALKDLCVWDTSFPPEMRKIFFLYARLSINLNRVDFVEKFKSWFYDPKHNYSANELTLLLPLLKDPKEKLVLLQVAQDEIPSSENIVTKKLVVQTLGLLDLGVDIINLDNYDFTSFFRSINYSNLYYFLNLYKYKPEIFNDNLLLLVKEFLLSKHNTKAHDINHVARITQYNKICELISGIKHSNYIYNQIYKNQFIKANDKTNKHVVLFVLSGCPVAAPLFSAMVIPLLSEGLQFYNLEDNGFVNDIVRPWDKTPRLLADSSNFIDGQTPANRLLNTNWEINLEKEILILDGINYYQGLYERMSRLFKVYEVNWEMPSVQLFYRLWLTKLDRILYALQDIYNVAKKEQMKVTLISLQSQFNPWYAMKMFSSGHSDIFQHITIGSSYENWTNNMSKDSLSTFAMLNNTLYPHPSMPAFGTREGFFNWYIDSFLPSKKEYIDNNTKLVSMKRSGNSDTKQMEELSKLVDKYKQQGKKVFCALGKIPYDMAVPYQGGPAHSSMLDWLNHTVNIIENNENLLLVKPHPHELNYSISAKPVQGFTDMIKTPLSMLKNTKILPHRGLNIQDLFDFVDVFICWNGSSIAELGSQGKKIIACDDWASFNYPIDVYLPQSRDDYENILNGTKNVEMHKDFYIKSIAYNSYLTQAPFAIKYPFVYRSSTNTKFHDVAILEDNFNKKNLSILNKQKSLIKKIFNI